MFGRIRCEDCGQFISNLDLDSGLVQAHDVWSYGVTPEIDHVAYYCVKCIVTKRRREFLRRMKANEQNHEQSAKQPI